MESIKWIQNVPKIKTMKQKMYRYVKYYNIYKIPGIVTSKHIKLCTTNSL